MAPPPPQTVGKFPCFKCKQLFAPGQEFMQHKCRGPRFAPIKMEKEAQEKKEKKEKKKKKHQAVKESGKKAVKKQKAN